jgi:hypothetical protein
MGRKITLPEAPPKMAAKESVRDQKSKLVEVENKSPSTSHPTKSQPSSNEKFFPDVRGKSEKNIEAPDNIQRQQRRKDPIPILKWICLTILAGFVITYLLAPPIHQPVDLGIHANDQVQIPHSPEQKLPPSPTHIQTATGATRLHSEPKIPADKNSKKLHRWTNVEGLVIEASFEGLEGKDHVLLRLSTGSLHKYPLNKLSPISRNLAQNNGTPKLWIWKNQNGKIIEASFEGLDGVDYVLLGLTNGQIHRYPIDGLSPECQRLALQLSAMLEALTAK